MTRIDMTRSDVQQNKSPRIDAAFVEGQLRTMANGLTEAMRREVETLRREGLPILVSDNGKVVDLQKTESHTD